METTIIKWNEGMLQRCLTKVEKGAYYYYKRPEVVKARTSEPVSDAAVPRTLEPESPVAVTEESDTLEFDPKVFGNLVEWDEFREALDKAQ